MPVTGDWDGDGTTTIGAFDPINDIWYLRNSNTPGAPDLVFAYGGSRWLPVRAACSIRAGVRAGHWGSEPISSRCGNGSRMTTCVTSTGLPRSGWHGR